ncbi:MAG: Gx transporter family protein [Spirochaetaceae bacterium]|jgi:heptaprenyl diphosphate synthase|nr:Gx transporter family protein [Spirochaetaceae bacterium]
MLKHGKIHERTKRIIAVLGAFCLFLSTIEYLVPKPLPFIRIGFANLPLLLALQMPFTAFITLVIVKIFSQSIISGTLFSYVFLFSATGTFTSALIMFCLRKFIHPDLMSITGISVLGSLCSNIAQIILARLFIFGAAVIYIAPPLLAIGAVTGFVLGFFCEKFMKESIWYKNIFTKSNDFVVRTPVKHKVNFVIKKDIIVFFAGFLLSVTILFISSPLIRMAMFLLFWVFAAFKKKSGNPFITILFFLSVALFNLIAPYGKIIAICGPFVITEGALLQGISKAAAVEGLVMLSRTVIPENFMLPGYFGNIVGESFRLLRIIIEEKKNITMKNFIGGIDSILIKCYSISEESGYIKSNR